MCEITATEKRATEKTATEEMATGKLGNRKIRQRKLTWQEKRPTQNCLLPIFLLAVFSVVFSVFVISDNFVLPFFLPYQFLVAEFSYCPIFRQPFLPLPFFLLLFFPLPLFHTSILCCPVFLPSYFSLPIFPIVQISGSHFFRCRFFSCRFFSCPFFSCRFYLLPDRQLQALELRLQPTSC